MSTYFGECNADGTLIDGAPDGYDTLGGSGSYNTNTGITYTCPGVGNQTVDVLGVYCRWNNSPSAGNIRLAIYDDSWNLVCYWDDEVLVDWTVATWYDKVTNNLTGTTTLTGGSDYHIVITGDNNNTQQAYNTGSSGDWDYSTAAEYTEGFPDPITPPATNMSYRYIVRCGVTASAGGATLVVADLAHVHSLETFALTQKHLLAVANLAHIHSLQAPALTQKHLLAVSDLLHSHGLEGVVLTQKHLLAVSDLLHTHGLENVVLVPGAGGVTLVVADLLHGHSLDNVALTQKHLLSVNGLLHSHGLEGVILTQKHLLAVDALLHGHSLEGVVLTQKHLLAISDLLHIHGLDAVVLTQKHIITVQDLLHVHNLNNVVLVLPGLWVSLDGIRFYLN